MPGVATTGSTNIAVLDSKIVASLCDGKFYVDVTPSIYIGDGAANVLGANVKITNPYGVVVKPYGDNYEIAPDLSGGMDAVIDFNIPTQASNYQYGKYKVEVQLFDDGGNSWVVTKYISICEPDKKNKTRNYGSLSAQLKASCKDGKLYVIVDNVPTYNGQLVESQVNEFTLEYPTSSGLDPLETAIGSFSVQLFEGVYKITGEICATYNFGDNVFVDVKYKIKREKNVRCLIDECCVFARLAELNLQLKNGCSLPEQERITSVTIDALLLLKTIQLAADCGEDASEYITDLEKLLGCTCTCNCAEGTPIINTEPAKDFNITGCNVSKETVGLTDNYIIENYEYVVEVAENGGILVASAAVLDGCTKTQTLTFSSATLYAQQRALANASDGEGEFWASVVNKSLIDIDPSCLGVSQETWNEWTFAEKWEAVLAKLCEGASCDAELSDAAVVQEGNNAILSWTNDELVFYIDIYLDGVLKGTVSPGLADIDEFTFEDVADFEEHVYTLVPKCVNGAIGTPLNGTFQYIACPEIAPPVVSSNNVNGVECPYDLTSLLPEELPAGISVEWHTANNTNASSLVPDPTNVSSGIYYAFAKDADGCFSISTEVTVICDAGESCTAPQSLLAARFGEIIGGLYGVLVTFKSAAYPPPDNSYTVKRRLASDPDEDGSYTTLDEPVWSSVFNRWIVQDLIEQNTLYVYKAYSNCGGSPGTTPSVEYTFAHIECHTVNATPGTDQIDYSLSTADSNEIDKFEIQIFDESGTIELQLDTFTPAFSDPLTGTFLYLEPATAYKIVVTAYIGTFKKTSCSVLNTATVAD